MVRWHVRDAHSVRITFHDRFDIITCWCAWRLAIKIEQKWREDWPNRSLRGSKISNHRGHRQANLGLVHKTVQAIGACHPWGIIAYRHKSPRHSLIRRPWQSRGFRSWWSCCYIPRSQFGTREEHANKHAADGRTENVNVTIHSMLALFVFVCAWIGLTQEEYFGDSEAVRRIFSQETIKLHSFLSESISTISRMGVLSEKHTPLGRVWTKTKTKTKK